MNYLRFILDLIYPSRCPSCKKHIGYMEDFCQECFEKINFCNEKYSIKNSDFSFSVCYYDENISDAIITLKDKGGNAPYAFAKGMAKLLNEHKLTEKIDFIVPVPMYKSDKLKRGFNQIELIAKELSKFTNIPYRFDIVYKSRKTIHQKNLSYSERLLNLKNAFSLRNPEQISQKSILLIDDVCTTGSTLSEIAGLLKKSNAKAVYCCTYCKTKSNKDN